MRRPLVCFEGLERRQLLAAAPRPTLAGSIGRAAESATVASRHASGDALATSVLTRTLQFGSPGAVGGFSFNQTSYSIDGAGTGIGGAADQFIFASAPMTQDFVVSAKLTFTGSGDTGVMIRNTGASPNAPMAALVVTAAGTLKFVTRATNAAVATSTDIGAVSTPIYLRLARAGYIVSASYSIDGLTWASVGTPTTIRFDSGASHAGIALSSGSANTPTAATFTNVAVAGQSANWLYSDVGSPAGAGSVGFDSPSGTHRLIAGGIGIGGTSDAFNFSAQPLAGDGVLVARVNTIDVGGEAGLMVRADAAAGSPFASLLTTSVGGLRFVYRTAAGAAAQQVTLSGTTTPISLKLYRSGNSVAAYYSVDGGASFVQLGSSVTIALSGTVQAGLAATANVADDSLITATFTGVSLGAIASPAAGILTPADEAFLDDLEFRTALWFTATENTTSGLFLDRASVVGGSFGGNISSAAATGFGLSALTIASSRGWIADGYDRALKTLNFLWTDADMANPANHGFFYHFVNQATGARSGTSELSTIDTALLIAGVIQAGQYWKGTQVEMLAEQIYERVDWKFFQPDGVNAKLRMAWTPESGFSSATWDSWSEGPILYLLAMGSPTHPISAASWLSFQRNQTTVTYGGRTFYAASGSPLFTNQYPQGWFDLRAKSDLADADPTANVVHMDPYQNSKNHTLAQRQASIDAAAGPDVRYDFYGANAWGLTASDSRTGYTVFGGPPFTSNVNGTIVPTAPGGSLAFTPRESIDDLANLKAAFPASYKSWGFVDAFNPRPGTENWYDTDALGIDQGMLLIAAENLRSGLVWSGFMANPAAQNAVSLAFTSNFSLVPPKLTSSQFNFETGQNVAFALSQDVTATLSEADITVKNLTTGVTLSPAEWALSKSTAGKPTTGTVTFFSILADGNYELHIAAGGVTGSDGVSNVGDLVVPFRVLAGDADRDGSVGFSDLVILAQNYGQSSKTFSQGNFDYSGGGTVDFQDLVILAQRYNTSLSLASMLTTLPATNAATSTSGKTRPTAGIL